MTTRPVIWWKIGGISLLVFLLLVFFPLFRAAVAAGGELPGVFLSSAGLFPGDVASISLRPAASLSAAHVVWDKKSIPLLRLEEKDAFAAFFAVPQDEKPGFRTIPLLLVSSEGRQTRRTLKFKILSKDFPVQRLTLPKEKVSLSEKDLKRHRREKAAVNKALEHPLDSRIWQRQFQAPVKGEVSTPFGVRRILNGKPRSSHSGVDLRGVLGEPVAAASDGIVLLTGDHFFAGNSVYIDHGMGLVTMYFHLSEITVKQGERVRAGQTVGLLGSTGRSTGPHLHWGLRVHNRPADPLSLLALFPLP